MSWLAVGLGRLLGHIEAIEGLLEREAESLRAEKESEGTKFKEDDEDRQVYYDLVAEDIYELEESLPQMQREAFLTAAISFAELELNKLCELVAQHRSQNLEVSDLKGAGIQRAKLYLFKAAGLKRAWGSREWHELLRAAELRNALVHNDGVIKNLDLQRYVTNSPHLHLIPSSGRPALEKSYVPYVLGQLQAIVHMLVEELDGSTQTFA